MLFSNFDILKTKQEINKMMIYDKYTENDQKQHKIKVTLGNNHSSWEDFVEKQENILRKEFLIPRDRRLGFILSLVTSYFWSLPLLPSVGRLSVWVMSS